MAAKHENLDELSSLELGRHLRGYNDRRNEISRELATLFAARQAGTLTEAQPLSDRARAARERATQMLNGNTPAGLKSPPAKGREIELETERDAIDLIVGILNAKFEDARYSESVRWSQEHAGEWKSLARDWILTAVQLAALEEKASAMLNNVVLGTPGFQLSEFVGRGAQVEIPSENLDHAVMSAIRQGVVTAADVKEAKNAKKSH